jgi:xylulokinase
MLLGIDIGTSGTRVAAFSEDGRRLAEASHSYGYDIPARGWAESDPEVFWTATRRALSELATKVEFDQVRSIAVVGQAPTIVLLDANGRPLRPAILWLDTRAETEARELNVPAYFLGPKLLWLARHAPDDVQRTHQSLELHAFIAYRLTGVAAVDPSTAALSRPLFDLAKLDWDPSMFARVRAPDTGVGITRAQLPTVRRSHERLGEVTAHAAEETGLRAGTPVVVGGGDFAAATLGAGALDEGAACLMLGTAGNLLVPRRAPGHDPRLINTFHVSTGDTWLSLGGTLSGGAHTWFRKAFAAEARSEPSFSTLDAEASSLPPGSERLLFLPQLQGDRTPSWNTSARGAYIGVEPSHGRGHLWRALLEGVALGFVECQATLQEAGVVIRNVVATDGGGQSSLFRQILADALGVPVAYAEDAGGTIRGAAILAALGSGVIKSAHDASLGSWRIPTRELMPRPGAHRVYAELLRIRREASSSLSSVFEGLRRFDSLKP